MSFHELLVLGAILVIVLGIFVVVWRIRADISSESAFDRDQLTAAIGETWREMEFDRTVHELESHAERMGDLHGDIEWMLRSPRERGQFGEQQLDIILGEHLPPDLYGIREQVVNGKTPDAYIEASSGLICIDAKFPLDNYEKHLDAEGDKVAQYKRAFRSDVESQLDKIANDYVRPSAGTMDFAFAFIPSESVYYHLISEEYDLLSDYTKRGVQVVSPLTFGQKLELIKADVQAQKLSEEAEEILDDLELLRARFEGVADEWGTLYRHITNAMSKADDVDRRYNDLRAAFDRIEQPSAAEERIE